MVRSAGDPLELVRPVQAVARTLDPDIPLTDTRTMEEALSASLASPRLRTAIFAGIAGLALLLAGIGIGHSLRLVVPGLALGLLGVLLSGRVLQSFLYEVEPGDPLTLLRVSASVALLVTAAALMPVRRAARTDPMAVLRGE